MMNQPEPWRWQPPEPPPRRISKKGLIIIAVIVLASTLCAGIGSFVYFDVDRVQMGYEEAKAAYLKEGMPWTSKDFTKAHQVPDSQNAGLLINEICRRYFGKRLHKPTLKPLGESNREAYVSYLPSKRKLLDLIAKELKAKPKFSLNRDWSKDTMVYTPEYPRFRRISKDFSARAQLRMADGDKHGALSDLTAAADLAVRIKNEGTMSSFLYSGASRKLVSSAACRCASLALDDAAFLKQLADVLEPLEAPYDYTGVIKTYAYMEIRSLRNLTALGGIEGLQRRHKGEVVSVDNTPILDSGDITGPVERSYATRFFAFWSSFAKETRKLPNDPFVISKYSDEKISEVSRQIQPSYRFLKIVLHKPSLFISRLVIAQAQVRASRAAILVCYERALGREPASLSEVPGGPWIDPFTETELHSKLGKEKVHVWSVGSDRKDQGGASSSGLPETTAESAADDVSAEVLVRP